jgi:hypothetical protein
VRQLTVVAVSDDGTHVLLASGADATKPTHQVAIDDRLAAAVRGELDTGPRRESALSPKEIQARLRSGDTPEQVAKAANVPVNRVLRFFGPVASERERIISQAQAATMRRTRGPVATLPLAEAAERRLATTTGLRRETVEWSAKRRDDGAWVVALTYSARGGERSAAWLWQPAQHDLTALDVAATRIAIEEAAPSRRPSVPSPSTASAKKRAARTSTNSRSTKSTAKRTARTKATPPQPAAEVLPLEVAPEEAVPASPRVRREPRVIAPPAARSGRIPVPTWDDVLFGAAPSAAAAAPADGDAAADDEPAATPKAPARGRRRS